MFSHVCQGVSNFDSGFSFYQPVMERLGIALRFSEAENRWAAWQDGDGSGPMFIVNEPLDEGAQSPGNGQMVAFNAGDRETVDAVHAIAMKNGGTDEGSPGLRPHYHPDYYGAYFRDPDGNKVCVVCHQGQLGK